MSDDGEKGPSGWLKDRYGGPGRSSPPRCSSSPPTPTASADPAFAATLQAEPDDMEGVQHPDSVWKAGLLRWAEAAGSVQSVVGDLLPAFLGRQQVCVP